MPQAPNASPSRLSRRFRFGSLSLILVLCVIASAVVIGALSVRYNRRWDLTATGEHRLAPRSARALESLDGPYEAIIAADLASLDRRARADVRDVLDRFEATGRERASGSGGLTTRTIDTSSAEGRAQYAELLRAMGTQDARAFDDGRAKVSAAAENARGIAKEAAQSLSPGLAQFIAGLTIPAGEAQSYASAARSAAERFQGQARDLTLAADATGPLLSRQIEGVALPALAEAAERVRSPLEAYSLELLRLEGTLRELAQRVPQSQQAIAKVADGVRTRRENADTIADQLARVPRPDSLLVADAVARSSCVLVRKVGAGSSTDTAGGGMGVGVRAIPIDELFSSASASADQRRKAEDLITSALLSISAKVRPIAVFVTAEPALASKSVKIYAVAAQRLRERGFDTLDWDLLQSPEPAGLAALNPRGTRPVVYVIRVPDTLQEAQGAFASGLDRARRIAQTAAELAEKGVPLFVQIGPSLLPVDREPDPIDATLAAFGLSARSDRVLLTESPSESGRRSVATDLFVDVPKPSASADSPGEGIREAVRGLPVLLPWATSLRIPAAHAPDVLAEPLLELPMTPNAWAESRWHAYKKLDRASRVNAEPPAFNADTDAKDGPWVVAAASQRPHPHPGDQPGARAQRLVAVASNEWLVDPVLRLSRGMVDGRQVPLAPGNAELFENAILWLSGQDDAIARTAAAAPIAMVRPIDDSRLATLRWLLLAGFPAACLIAGVLYRRIVG